MRSCYFFSLPVVCLMLVSCNTDTDDVGQTNLRPQSAFELCDSYYDNKDVCVAEGDSSSHASVQTRAVVNPLAESDIMLMMGYGYSNTDIAGGKTRVAYSSDNPIVVGAGLPGGTYFVEILRVTKNLSSYRAGDLILPSTPDPEKKDMGVSSAGYFISTLGWVPSEMRESGDKSFYGTTYLIHFLYDLGGAQVDRYYPCHPEDLVWNYSSIKYDF